MSRRVRNISLQNASGQDVDKYFDRVIKYIPSDIIGAWVAVSGVLGSPVPGSADIIVMWSIFIVFFFITPLWTLKQTKEIDKSPAFEQALISTIAFSVWVFALGGPFAGYEWYDHKYGSLVIIIFSLVSGLYTPPDKRLSS